MPNLLRIAGAAALSIALGLASAYAAVRSGLSGGEVSNGPWRTSFVTGSSDADLYTRARVAVGGLLALAPSETVYWNTDLDSEGRALDAGCDYRVAGEELPARWWSLTAYGADHFLIANDAGRYSFSQTTLAREPGGPWTMQVSSEPQGGVASGARSERSERSQSPGARSERSERSQSPGARSEAKPSEASNWLPSGRAGARGPFALTLRLYNPEPAVYEQPAQLALPGIMREACR